MCRLEGLRIETPPTEADYLKRCPLSVYGPSVACLRWSSLAPVAVVHPSVALTEPLVAHQAIHELLHAYVYCSGVAGLDYYDGRHSLAEVWAGPGGSRPDSVEQRAQRALGD